MRTSCVSQCVTVLCYTSIFPHDLCDRWCDRGRINSLAYLIASSTVDGLSRCRIIAPMTPRFTQTTSYQRDVLYCQAEILAPRRRPWTGRAFIARLPVRSLTLMVSWLDKRNKLLLYQQRQVTEGPGVSFHQSCLSPRILRSPDWVGGGGGGLKKAQFPPDGGLHSSCIKAGSRRVIRCGGKQLCYPNTDLRRVDFGQQESQQERL